jgi:hypothetical protein
MRTRPRSREIFAIQTGTYAGEMWIFCRKDKTSYSFLSIPVMENRNITKELYENGINGGVITFVEKIPRYVYSIAKKQFIHNEKTSNN